MNNYLKERPGVLTMNFVGFLRNDGKGFYRSQYTFETEKKKILAATQFEVKYF